MSARGPGGLSEWRRRFPIVKNQEAEIDRLLNPHLVGVIVEVNASDGWREFPMAGRTFAEMVRRRCPELGIEVVRSRLLAMGRGEVVVFGNPDARYRAASTPAPVGRSV